MGALTVNPCNPSAAMHCIGQHIHFLPIDRHILTAKITWSHLHSHPTPSDRLWMKWLLGTSK